MIFINIGHNYLAFVAWSILSYLKIYDRFYATISFIEIFVFIGTNLVNWEGEDRFCDHCIKSY